MKSVTEIINNKYKTKTLELERYFSKSLEDDTFKYLVNKLKIDKNILMKYTSKLENTCHELKNCKNCKGILNCKNEIEGYVNYPSYANNNLIFEYISCKYKKDIDKKSEYRDNVYMFDVPKEVRNASMKDIYTDEKNRVEIIKWLHDFIDNYDDSKKGLYLTGNFGCGKTYLISAMFNEMAKKGKKVAIIYFPEFLRTLKSSFDDDFEVIFDKVKKSELLLIDDIGAEAVTAWGRDEVLGTILQYRMDEGLKTFFTSNLSLMELETHFGNTFKGIEKVKARRIIERIKQLSIEKVMISVNKRK